MHVARFGDRFDAQGVLSGSKDAAQCIGYLTKYLTKQVADCHQAQTDTERAHAERLAEALRFEPCSPRCANWLRYGIQPKNARPGLVPGACKGKAHRREYLGYCGRRVLNSRKWSGRTLADHRAQSVTKSDIETVWLPAWLPEQQERPLPDGRGASDLGALGGTRTPDLLIRSKIRAVQRSPQLSDRAAHAGCGRRLVPRPSEVRPCPSLALALARPAFANYGSACRLLSLLDAILRPSG